MRKSQKGGKLENLGIIGLLRRNIGNPRRGVDLRQGVENPRRGEVEVPKMAGVATVHNEQFLEFCFRTPRTDSLRTLINY